MRRKNKQTEDSVNVALRKLLTLEDERQYEETKLLKQVESEGRCLREEEAHRKAQAEVLERKRAEEALLKAEREDRERKEQVEREDALRLARIEIEARTRAEVDQENRRCLNEIQASPRSFSRRAVLVTTTLIIVNALAVASLYFYSQDQTARFERAHKSTMRQWRETYESQLTDANRRVYDARLEAMTAKEKSERLEDRLESALATKPVETRTVKKGSVKTRARPQTVRNHPPKDKNPDGLNGDPLQEFKVDK
jgi:hypothetical protein